ncbi:MAG: 1-aminocyclopropane-1-carboxylate deaminase [endosymbiont of Galathealinum brachiosum]|uniref:1-aminocyclopropane-1-carboxylate deaminase n=1 Tax=endosymbiont of Galathealinum brachiosum TaxID=2200906 RepID=A0A370D987_9GAMM|nr:MAG: 1-aminocyclopropane-1-carboxylate deaminase [endosymbiont of Galathealinum brachiosum]
MSILEKLNLPSPVTQIKNPLLDEKKIQLFIKRDELIHPVIQGNKWRKLKYNLLKANNKGKKTLLSFGGAYSNHLHALAAAGKELGFKTIGIIRGEAPRVLNPCLQDMMNWGMQLKFITRLEYKQKNNPEFIKNLKTEFSDFYLIPEGGNNTAGKKGCAELLDELEDHYDVICCEVGSGTMLSSLIHTNTDPDTRFLGFAVMKNTMLNEEINASLELSKTLSDWTINHEYHFGGFAKSTPELNDFIVDFKQTYNIQLEPVYSGKMLWGILDLVKYDYFKKGSKILAIHGGGLQGLRGFKQFKEKG